MHLLICPLNPSQPPWKRRKNCSLCGVPVLVWVKLCHGESLPGMCPQAPRASLASSTLPLSWILGVCAVFRGPGRAFVAKQGRSAHNEP